MQSIDYSVEAARNHTAINIYYTEPYTGFGTRPRPALYYATYGGISLTYIHEHLGQGYRHDVGAN